MNDDEKDDAAPAEPSAGMAGTVIMSAPTKADRAEFDTPEIEVSMPPRVTPRVLGAPPPLTADDAAVTRMAHKVPTPPPLRSRPPAIPPPAFGPPPSLEPPSPEPPLAEPPALASPNPPPARPAMVPAPEPPPFVESPRAETTNEAPALPPAPLPPPPDETRAPQSRPETKAPATPSAANLGAAKPQAVNRVGPQPPSAVKRWALPILLLAGAAAFGGYLVATKDRRAPAAPPASQATTTTAKSATNTAPAKTAANTAAPTPATVDGPPPLAAAVATSSASVAPPAPATAAAPAADLAACVGKVLPLGPALQSPALQFLCTDADARDAARSMTVALAATSDVPMDSRRRWAGMGWFQMATAQLLRSRCCGDVATMSGPPNLESCGTGPALGEIHRAVAASASLDDAAKTYFTAVDCLFKANTAKLFGQRRRPNAAELTSFVELSQGG